MCEYSVTAAGLVFSSYAQINSRLQHRADKSGFRLIIYLESAPT